VLSIGGVCCAPRLVILDKDGTLVAFDVMWHAWFSRFKASLQATRPLSSELGHGMARTLGYDQEDGRWDPQGPLTLASTGEILLLTAGLLYQHQGITWDEALTVVHRAERYAREVLSDPALVRPIGDVRGWLQKLHSAGLKLALVTTDNRASTEEHLRILDISHLFDMVLCGDDGVPLKPAPDMALAVCQQLQIPPSDAIMIGDSVVDMLMARNAGLAVAIGVSSGSMPAELLQRHADCVVPDIHAIKWTQGQHHG
jgi:phosphoglycolate phosphatase